jgi:hypothetical protein
MIKAMVSIEVDLESSLAIRFACQLGGLMDMEVTPVYVKEFVSRDVAMGAGWASKHWERELIYEGKQEIAEMVATEMDFCPALKEPKVIYGEREAELVKMTQTEDFDLFVEGAHFSWNKHELHKKLRHNLYQSLHHPLVLVRMLRKINEATVLCLNVEGTQAVVDVLRRLWKNCPIPLRLVGPWHSSSRADAALTGAVEKAADDLKKVGCEVRIDGPISPRIRPISDPAQDGGLIVVAIHKNAETDSEEIQWLERVNTAVLVVFYPE